VPRTCRRIDDRAFSVAAPRAWNRLPTDLKLLRSTTSFRRQLETFLFKSAYVQRKQTDDCFVMRPPSSAGRNIDDLVTVTVHTTSTSRLTTISSGGFCRSFHADCSQPAFQPHVKMYMSIRQCHRHRSRSSSNWE